MSLDLRREVERLRADLDALVGVVEALTGLMDPQDEAPRSAPTSTRSRRAGRSPARSDEGLGQPEAVDAIGRGPPGESGRRWCWKHAGIEERRRLWWELAAFVDWLNTRYQLPSDRRIPPCWYRHGSAVEELTALYAAWLAGYAPDECDGPIAWHDRWLWPCLERLQERQFRRCDQRHAERPTTVRRPVDAGFDAWVAADLSAGGQA